MTLRQRLIVATDRALAAAVVSLLAGTIVGFGGRVWWGPPALAVGACSLAALSLGRVLLEGPVRVLKSPLSALAVIALGLATGQLAPLPARVAEKVARASRAVHTTGSIPSRARGLSPDPETLSSPAARSPVSLNRPATLRWVGAAAACLVVFLTLGRFTDRLGHLYLVWGSVVAAFFLNTAVAAVQLACGEGGVFGFLRPGRGPSWGPTLVDLSAGPGSSVLRAAGPAAGQPAWALPVADRAFEIGSQMGGAGAYLALGSIGLPLALALILQLMAPRGSRESLPARLRQSGQGSLVLLLSGLLAASGLLVGLLAGPWLSLPFAASLLLVGLPSSHGTGLGWGAVGMTFLVLLALASGAAGGVFWAASTTSPPPVAAESLRTALRVWADALPITRDFPWLGTGLGTFASVYPDYKTGDATPTTAMSSLLQWWIEAGGVGFGLLALAGFWCLVRLPGALGRVGSADRALAFGLIGAAAGFTLFSTVHWTVELVSVALAASAVAGGMNRWLAGGTDLFVERG